MAAQKGRRNGRAKDWERNAPVILPAQVLPESQHDALFGTPPAHLDVETLCAERALGLSTLADRLGAQGLMGKRLTPTQLRLVLHYGMRLSFETRRRERPLRRPPVESDPPAAKAVPTPAGTLLEESRKVVEREFIVRAESGQR